MKRLAITAAVAASIGLTGCATTPYGNQYGYNNGYYQNPQQQEQARRAATGAVVGAGVLYFLSPTLQLIIGIPAILAAFGTVLWTTGLGPEDRELFRMRNKDVKKLRAAAAAIAHDEAG